MAAVSTASENLELEANMVGCAQMIYGTSFGQNATFVVLKNYSEAGIQVSQYGDICEEETTSAKLQSVQGRMS